MTGEKTTNMRGKNTVKISFEIKPEVKRDEGYIHTDVQGGRKGNIKKMVHKAPSISVCQRQDLNFDFMIPLFSPCRFRGVGR